jgi:hypothetical protein
MRSCALIAWQSRCIRLRCNCGGGIESMTKGRQFVGNLLLGIMLITIFPMLWLVSKIDDLMDWWEK